MPTYQYACTACGNELEAVQSFSDEPLTECPACAGRLRKVFSTVGVVFKGSGFYRTDSRSSNTPDQSGDKSADKGGTEKTGGEKKETAAKDSATKDSGTKDSGSKDSGSRDSGGKGSGSKDTKPSTTSSKTPATA